MTDQPPQHGILEKAHRLSQKLKLTCCQCGKKATYDVGTVLCDTEGQDDQAETRYAFSNYFRCRECGSAGPWTSADPLKMLGLTLRARVDREFEGLRFGKCALFDGTVIQTPALGEEYLLSLIRKDPSNGFLCSRLGNLLRNCGQSAQADHWHTTALELDPHDIESRHHLFYAALDAGDIQSALPHALRLARSLLEGHKTDNDRLNEDIALSLAEDLRGEAEQFRACLPAEPSSASSPKEEVFIRTLLAQTGDEQDILEDAAERLLKGKPAPEPKREIAENVVPTAASMADLFPTLRAIVESSGLNPERLTVPLEQDEHSKIILRARQSVFVTDGRKAELWQAPTLQELFRGDRKPPPDMDRYPEQYAPHFFFLEEHLLALCDAMGDRTDQEMEEIYSMLRRRPAGRSLGLAHDFLWQASALLLATRPMSAAEFEALIGALERSVRKWALRPISRNYVGYLRRSFDGEPE
jgi:hypothetical protein